ncbi:MAG: TerB family tellurite resistance protein [Proteobacteria bacterium]|nr:TerB family tellurite resistance protein [Pseudomonadota bacterium]
MRSLRKLLSLDPDPVSEDARDTATVRRIADQLDQLPAGEARFIASFAYVLARVAHADYDVSAAEVDRMVEQVSEHGGLSQAQATLVVEIARSQQVTLGGTENYVVTRQFKQLSERPQRLALLRCLFAVAAADDSISETESAEVLQIGRELGFTRQEVLGVRSSFREQLAVLRQS